MEVVARESFRELFQRRIGPPVKTEADRRQVVSHSGALGPVGEVPRTTRTFGAGGTKHSMFSCTPEDQAQVMKSLPSSMTRRCVMHNPI